MADSAFWNSLEELVARSEIVIDRPKGSARSHFPGMTYPFDYGYLAGTVAADGGGIDVWLGMQASANERRVTGVICAVDLLKRDSEIKILLGGGGADYRGIYEPRRFTLPTGQAHLLKAEKTQDRQYRKQSIL